MNTKTLITSSSSGRLHGLDTLRAHMMLLGVLFHAALSYIPSPATGEWPLKDPYNSTALWSLVGLLSSFRMPVFFIVAGFFFCLLQDRRGLDAALEDRQRRIIVPFIIFLPLMFLFCGYGFLHGMEQMPATTLDSLEFDWHQLYHLWFLYFLIFFYAASDLSSRLLKRLQISLQNKSEKTLLLSATLWSGLFSLLMWAGSPLDLTAPIEFIPKPDALLFYGYFFSIGYWLYFQKSLLGVLERRFWWFLSGSIMLAVLGTSLVNRNPQGNTDISWFDWLFLASAQLGIYFTIIAGYLRWANKASPISAYFSSASYWVYLVHLPLVIWMCNILQPVALNAYAKLVINIGATLIISIASYHFLVRNTWLGQLLNGKKSSTAPATPLATH